MWIKKYFEPWKAISNIKSNNANNMKALKWDFKNIWKTTTKTVAEKPKAKKSTNLWVVKLAKYWAKSVNKIKKYLTWKNK